MIADTLKGREQLFQGVFLLLASVVPLLPHLYAYFASDDLLWIRGSLVQSPGDLMALLAPGAGEGVGGFYRPLVSLTFALNFALGGLDPLGYHLFNMMVHLGATLAVYALGRHLAPGQSWRAFLAALLFALHPVHAEAVSWISGRADLLCCLFYVLSLLLALKAREGTRPYLLSTLSVLAFLLALASKEMAVTLPLVLVVLDALDRPAHTRAPGALLRAALRTSPHLLLLGAYFLWRLHVLGGLGGYHPAAMFRHRSVLISLAYYVGTLLAPINAESLKPYFREHVSLLVGLSLVLAVVSGALGYLIYRSVSRSRLLVVGALLAALSLLPVLKMTAERFLYLPSAGFCLVLSALLFDVSERLRRLRPLPWLPALGGLILCAYVGLYGYKNHLWHRAGDLVWSIDQDILALLPTLPGNARLFFIGLPDNVEGAQVLRNGLPELVRLRGGHGMEAFPLVYANIEDKRAFDATLGRQGAWSFRYEVMKDGTVADRPPFDMRGHLEIPAARIDVEGRNERNMPMAVRVEVKPEASAGGPPLFLTYDGQKVELVK